MAMLLECRKPFMFVFLVIASSFNSLAIAEPTRAPTERNRDAIEIDVELSIAGWSVSRSGKFAAVWGRNIHAKSRHVPLNGNVQLAVVDLSNRKVVGHQLFNAPIMAAKLDDGFAYVALERSPTLLKVTHKGTIEEQWNLMDSIVTDLDTIHPDHCMLVGFRENAGFHSRVWKLINLKTGKIQKDSRWIRPAGNQPAAIARDHQHPERVTWLNSKLGWIDSQYLFDLEKDRIAMLGTTMAHFPTILHSAEKNQFLSNGKSNGTSWPRTVSSDSLRDRAGNQVFEWDKNRHRGFQSRATILKRYPVLVSQTIKQDFSNRNESVASLEFRDLIKGNVLDRIKFKFKPSQIRHSSSQSTQFLFDLGDSILVSGQRQLYLVPLDESKLSKAASPFQIEYPEIVSLDASSKNKIDLITRGGTISDFKLATQYDYVSIDPKTGMINIDAAKLTRHFLSNQRDQWIRFEPAATADESVLELKKSLRVPNYVCPVNLPLVVEATAEDGQTDRIFFNLLMYIPLDQFQKELDSRQEKSDLKVDDASKNSDKTGGAQSSRELDIIDRIKKLERKVVQLENQIRSLSKAIQQLVQRELRRQMKDSGPGKGEER